MRYAERQMQTVSGVKAVTTTSALPLSASLPMPFKVFEYNTSAGLYDGIATWRSVSPDYFKVFGIGLLRGRLFMDGDDEHAPAVVLINRAMAKRYWTDINANPIGDYLAIGHAVEQGPADPPRQIVGVVADVHDAGLDHEPAMYIPVAQVSDWMNARNNRLAPMIWAIRVDEGKSWIAPRLLQELSSLLGGQPIGPAITMREAIAASSARIRFYIILLSVFGGMALALTGIGTYSLLSYSVEQRRKELAIRSALGAGPLEASDRCNAGPTTNGWWNVSGNSFSPDARSHNDQLGLRRAPVGSRRPYACRIVVVCSFLVSRLSARNTCEPVRPSGSTANGYLRLRPGLSAAVS